MQKQTLRLSFLAPITKAMSKDFDHNVFGFRNGGNSTVVFNNGAWNLLPGETLMVGSQTDGNILVINSLNISFIPTPGETAAQVDILQILVINPDNC